MATTRERKLAKAERLREWAAKREQKADALRRVGEEYRHDWAFVTQPGHIPARAAMNRRDERAYEIRKKGGEMASRAAGIEDQVSRAIYSDDPDACEALAARIGELESKRDAMKARNVVYRKEHAAELKTMTAYGRSQAVPFPPYSITNLTADIARNKKRLAELSTPRPASWRLLEVRYGGECDKCSQAVERGSLAMYCKAEKTLRHQACHG